VVRENEAAWPLRQARGVIPESSPALQNSCPQ
jgi:hypothetical protein